MAWQDTIKEILSFGGKNNNEYTLIEYIKGGEMEWNVAHHYDKETKSWSAGNYCYSLQSALATCLEKMQSEYVKSVHQLTIERKYGLTYDRLSELATQFKDGLIEDDEEQAIIYFDKTCEMTDEEKEYFGIK